MVSIEQNDSLQTTKSAKRGFTLTEIAIVLGIIGLILGAVWAAASNVYGNMKVSDAENGILSTSQAVRSMYATSNTTGGTAWASITTPGMFPLSWNSSTAGVVGNPWQKNPAKNYSYVYGNGSQYLIELDGISDSGCAALISYFSSAASGTATGTGNGGMVTGLVGSAVAITAPTAGTAKIGTITSGTYAAPTACKGGGLLDSVAIGFDMANM